MIKRMDWTRRAVPVHQLCQWRRTVLATNGQGRRGCSRISNLLPSQKKIRMMLAMITTPHTSVDDNSARSPRPPSLTNTDRARIH